MQSLLLRREWKQKSSVNVEFFVVLTYTNCVFCPTARAQHVAILPSLRLSPAPSGRRRWGRSAFPRLL